MKAILRSGIVQAIAAWLIAAYLKVTLRTIRWRREGMADAEAVWDAGGPVIVCFWHSRISLSPACWPLDRAQEPRALISQSADGEMIARTMARIGFPAIRGSTAKTPRQAPAKGGGQAFREIIRWLRAGNGVAIPPDGPRGPAEQMTEGPPMLARVSHAPVLFVGLASKPCLILNSWDKAVLPLPFTRGAISWQRQPDVAAGADLAALRVEWAQRLSAVTRKAEAALA